MSVMVGVNVKNAAIWLPRFLCQVEKLKGDINRIVVMYGTSEDATFSILDHWRKVTKHKVEIYAEPVYLPHERGGAVTLEKAERDVQNILRNGEEEYYLKLDSDLVQLPRNLIPHLINDDLDVVAPYAWTEGRKPKTFWDVYCFRKDGCRFHPTRPPTGDKPIEVDSFATCFLAKREPALAGVYSNPHPLIQFCFSLTAKGFHVWADPRIGVTHFDSKRLGILHYPTPGIALSYVPYITDTGEKISPEAVQAELFHEDKKSYDEWVKRHRPLDAEWIKQFNSSRPLITASYKVFNEAKFLDYSLKSIYPYVDRIDIVEGAMKSTMSLANDDGSSTDGTVEIIKNFPDPDKKIRLVQGKWKTREHTQTKLLELCSGKWMLFIDGDEILDAQSMINIKRFCEANQDGNIVYARPARFYNFWHDFKHIAYSLNPLSPWAQYGLPHAFLVWRDIPGLNFVLYHTIPVDGFGVPVSLDRFSYRKRQRVLDNVFVYHFGNAKGVEAMKYKFITGHPRLLGDAEVDPWFSGVMPADMILEKFNGKFPELLKEHPDFGKQRIRITETKPVYKFREVG